jgi:hypothetical protein
VTAPVQAPPDTGAVAFPLPPPRGAPGEGGEGGLAGEGWAGVLTFASPEVAHLWAETSQSFGGIAVIGDTWAMSLDSDGSGGTSKAESRAPAAKITESVGGTVR